MNDDDKVPEGFEVDPRARVRRPTPVVCMALDCEKWAIGRSGLCEEHGGR